MNFEPEKLLQAEPFKPFLKTWKAALKDDDRPPFREDISLKKFAKFVANMSVMERLDTGRFRFRLMGSEMTERTELSKDRHSMTDLLPDDFAGENIRTWTAVLDMRVGAIGQFSVHYPNGNCRDCITIMLPIRAKDGSPLVMALTQAGRIFAVRDLRKTMEIGVDYAFSQLFDVGFGLPENAADYAITRLQASD